MTLDQQIRELNTRLMSLTSSNAELLGEYFDPLGDALASVRAHRMPPLGERLQVPPALLPAEIRPRLARLHAAFRCALDHVFDHRMDGQWGRLADELRLDDATRRYLDFGRRPRWATLGRPDVVVSGDVITMVEPNAGSSSGAMPDIDILGRVFESSPVIGDFLRAAKAIRPDGMRAVAEMLRHCLHAGGFSPDALVVVSELRAEFSDPGFYHCDVFAAELRRHGVRAEVGAAEDLDCGGAADSVSFRGERCALIYRAWGEQPDPVRQFPVLAPLLRAARAGRVILVDDLGDQIAVNKTVLALVSEELDRGTLPSRLAKDLACFIPWSRVVEDGPATVGWDKVDLVPWCLRHQEDLVLKPGSGYHGRGVTLGCEVSQAQWDDALQEALSSPEAWIVQRLSRSNPVDISVSRDGRLTSDTTFVDYGYFVVDSVIPASAIRRNAPFGAPTRRVKRAGHGPVFFV